MSAPRARRRGCSWRHHRRPGTAHAVLISEILNVLAGRKPASPLGESRRLREPLSQSEMRVLRYLPTKLSAPEIAGELYLSVNTVKTHMRHLYGKLGVHRRHEAVQQARAFGLLAPSPRRLESPGGVTSAHPGGHEAWCYPLTQEERHDHYPLRRRRRPAAPSSRSRKRCCHAGGAPPLTG